MNNVFIIHSFGGGTKQTFGPYVVENCKKMGLDVYFPDFPIKEEATYEGWSRVMDEYLQNKTLNEDSIIIAHSLGTHFIPKYLSENNIKINLYITCAGFIHKPDDRPDLDKVLDDFKPTKHDIEKLISLTNKRYAIYSDNDPLSTIKQSEEYANLIKAEKILAPDKGHMGKLSKITELKEVVDIIKNNI